MAEVCVIFQVSKPTIYDWIKNGKLKPYKIRSRVYFLARHSTAFATGSAVTNYINFLFTCLIFCQH